MALKTSVLVFYLRLSKNTQQVLRVSSWVVLAIVNIAGVVLTLLNIFQCRPVHAAFSVYSGEAQCIPLLTEFICSAPVNIVTDLAILALPIPVLTGMRLPKRQKYILVFTFSLGVFVTIVDVVRIYYLQQAITSTTPASGTSSDPTAIFGDSPEFAWNASLSLMWSAVEVNVGMICACIPTLKPLIIKFLPAAIRDPNGTQQSDLNTYATGSQEKGAGHGGRQAVSEPPTSPRQPPDTISPAAPAAHPESAEEQMDFLEFLTIPDHMNTRPSPPDQLHSPPTRATWRLSHATAPRRESALYFGFVNMKRPKSMIKTSSRESLHYCVIVTVLFLLWGFSYGLLNTLNQVIASIANMSTAETIGLTSAYFGGGYFFGPLVVGEWVLRHDEHARFHHHHRHNKHRADPVGGFKATFIMGLAIYGVGTIMFWPCAVLASYPGFIISNFVVGFGLAVLETAANPFLILCGPPQYAETRILLAQGVQGVASVLSGLLAQKVFFVNLPTTTTSGAGNGGILLVGAAGELLDVQWTYLAITLFCVALALFFYYMPLPEVRDAELGRAAQRLPVDPQKRSGVGRLQLRTVMIVLAVLAQWTYVAAQESMSIFFRNLMTAFLAPQSQQQSSTTSSPTPSDWPAGLALSVTDYHLLAHAAFTLSRFNAAHITYLGVRYPTCRFLPTPRTMLTALTGMSILTALLCVVLRPYGNPNLIAVPAVLFFFAEGPLWPLIFALGLRGQGDRTKRASAWLTMAASGPAVWPFVMYGIMGGRGGSARRLQLAFVVVVVLMVFTLAYPVFLTVVRDARDIVDNDCKGDDGLRGRVGGLEGGGACGGDITSGRTTRDQSLNPAGLRRTSTASTSGGMILGLADRVRAVGKKRREKWRKGSESSSGGSPQFEHWEMRRDSGHGGLGPLGENRSEEGVAPDTIPGER